MTQKEMLQATIDIVRSYVAGNPVALEELPRVIKTVREALAELEASVSEGVEKRREPAVPVRKSLTRRHIRCLEDGKPFKSLKGHLRAAHGLTPEAYRVKWGLAADYPMVAPEYSAKRAKLAAASKPWRHIGQRAKTRDGDDGPLKHAA